MGTNEIYLKLDGVTGECSAAKHEGDIEVLSVSWGVQGRNPTDPSTGHRASSIGKMTDIVVTTRMDKSTTALMQCAVDGRPIKNGKLTMRKAGGTQLEYFIVEMEGVIVASVTTTARGEDTPFLTVTLNFARVKVNYVPQGPTGGPGGGATTFVHDAHSPRKK